MVDIERSPGCHNEAMHALMSRCFRVQPAGAPCSRGSSHRWPGTAAARRRCPCRRRSWPRRRRPPSGPGHPRATGTPRSSAGGTCPAHRPGSRQASEALRAINPMCVSGCMQPCQVACSAHLPSACAASRRPHGARQRLPSHRDNGSVSASQHEAFTGTTPQKPPLANLNKATT